MQWLDKKIEDFCKAYKIRKWDLPYYFCLILISGYLVAQLARYAV